jgi:hypothetical protein
LGRKSYPAKKSSDKAGTNMIGLETGSISGRTILQGHWNMLTIRPLDCAVIEIIHASNRESGKPEFDTVRGVFFEGDPLYPNAGFREKNHIRICVRTPRSIKGFFRPIHPEEGMGFQE